MPNAKCTCHFRNNSGFKWHLQMKFSRGPIFMTIVAIYRVEICYYPVIISYVMKKLYRKDPCIFIICTIRLTE